MEVGVLFSDIRGMFVFDVLSVSSDKPDCGGDDDLAVGTGCGLEVIPR
jgi:hypothetical protein